ncbi:hypothetical protein E2C01_097130 [Portunus trituberculatus]|uniref:Uncharacterized protein n=1 Tax=Portunus trituberculatus TaxID=210409 RepID=A0A5B7K3U2_PORTR|nr:hypothetical protein [Portunus trituberculatus]
MRPFLVDSHTRRTNTRCYFIHKTTKGSRQSSVLCKNSPQYFEQ